MKTRFAFTLLVLLISSVATAQNSNSPAFLLDADDTVHVKGGVGGHLAFHIPISNIGDSNAKIGVPFIIPFAAPFMMLGNVIPDPIPSNGVGLIGISYNPTKEGCDTAYLYIPYPSDNQLVIVIIACTEFANAVIQSNATELGVSVSPNPFNSQTSIAIVNASPTMKVTLSDLLGNITILPSHKQIVLDSKTLGLREGKYILRIENDARILARNIIFLK